MKTPALKTVPFMLSYYCFTNAKLFDWLILFIEYSHIKVHLDITSNQVPSDIRGSVVYYNS